MKWRERALAIALGLFVTVVALEGLLRVVGWGAQRLAPSGTRDASAIYTIMCVGDSFTEGYWALQSSETYPALLEKVFAERLGPGKVRVVNRGQSGQNTYQVLNRLDDDLDAVKPDAVVVLAGGANEWDLFSYHRYCEGDSWASALKDSLYRLRVFKLVKLLARDVASRSQTAQPLDRGIFGTPYYTLRSLRALRQTTEKGQQAYSGGMAYWDEASSIRIADLAPAEARFREVLEHDPDSVGAWINIGWLNAVKGDADGGISAFIAAYEANGRKPAGRASRLVSIKIMKTLQLCVACFPAWRSRLEAQLSTRMEAHPETRKDFETFLRTAAGGGEAVQAGTGEWIRSDLAKMVRKCQERGAVVVLENYPRYEPSMAPAWEPTLAGVARDSGALFVDQRQVFDPLPERTRYFADDQSHPNLAGNRVMAENVMKVLLGSLPAGLAPSPGPSASPR